MIALTGLLRTIPAESFWGRFQPSINLEPHQAIFFLTEKDYALHRVELSGAAEKTVLAEPACHGLIVTRDFGVRLSTPCHFEGGLAGEVETEVRLRCLDNAADWPRWIARGRSEPLGPEDGSPDRQLARLIAGLFEAELVRLFADQPYREVSRRLNDPAFVAQVETQVRAALSRWSDERVVGLVAVHLLKIHSAEGERLERSEVEALQAQARLEREHRLRVLAAKQAAELAALQPVATVNQDRERLAPAPAELVRPPPPRPIASPAQRQQSIQRVLGSLAGVQPAAVQVRMFAWAAGPAGNLGEFIRTTPQGSPALRLGDEIHVVVESPAAGFLHLFNLGSSGEVTPLIPEGEEPPVRVEAGLPYLVSTGAAITPVAMAGSPISPWVEQGPVNGYHERILAVVTAESTPLPASELHPAWSGPAAIQPSGVGFGAPQVEATLSARSPANWAWGLAEAAVAP